MAGTTGRLASGRGDGLIGIPLPPTWAVMGAAGGLFEGAVQGWRHAGWGGAAFGGLAATAAFVTAKAIG